MPVTIKVLNEELERRGEGGGWLHSVPCCDRSEYQSKNYRIVGGYMRDSGNSDSVKITRLRKLPKGVSYSVDNANRIEEIAALNNLAVTEDFLFYSRVIDDSEIKIAFENLEQAEDEFTLPFTLIFPI